MRRRWKGSGFIVSDNLGGIEASNVGNWGETVVLFVEGWRGFGRGYGPFCIYEMSVSRFEGAGMQEGYLYWVDRCYVIVDAVCKGLDYSHGKSLHDAQNAQNEIRLPMHVYPLMH